MSYMGVDPGDLTPEQMYGSVAQADGSPAGLCRGCHAEDGTLATETMDDEGTCTFGCGRKVDPDTRVCGFCQDHSANEWECPRCGIHYANWSGRWERVS